MVKRWKFNVIKIKQHNKTWKKLNRREKDERIATSARLAVRTGNKSHTEELPLVPKAFKD
jgi:hypothetical protein